MFGSEMLEVAIGVVFVFLLVSIICSAVREGIEGWLKTRAAFLEHGVRELLHDRAAVGLARSFYTHPLIFSLYAADYVPGRAMRRPSALARGGQLPSYIPARNFALALLDIAARGPETDADSSAASSPVLSLAEVRANVLNLENAAVQRVLLTAIDTAQGSIDRAVASVGDWYDSAMDRVSGAYKRATQRMLFAVGLVVAIALNVNALTIADYLYRNDAARAAIVARAERVARDSTILDASYAEARAALDSLRIPLGWSRGIVAGAPPRVAPTGPAWGWTYVLNPAIGWLCTALAATFGAPFWFDMLNKIMVIRSTVKPHEKSPEESSEDRQRGPDATRPATPPVGGVSGPEGLTGEGAPAVAAVVAVAPAPAHVVAPPLVAPPLVGRAPAPSPPDAESAVDGCDVASLDPTPDDELPPAQGGVA